MTIDQDHQRAKRFVSSDAYLEPHLEAVERRIALISKRRNDIAAAQGALADFASGHEYYGLHFKDGEWLLREWAPNATALYLIGELSGWQMRDDLAFRQIDANGTWELRLPGERLKHADLYRLHLQWPAAAAAIVSRHGHGGWCRIPAASSSMLRCGCLKRLTVGRCRLSKLPMSHP